MEKEMYSNAFVFSSFRNCLMQTLVNVIQSLEFAKAKGIKVRFHDRQKNEPAHYCGQCEVSWWIIKKNHQVGHDLNVKCLFI